LKFASPSSDLLEKYSLDDGTKGAVITFVRSTSLGARAQLKVGDVITRINDTPVKSAEEAGEALAKIDLSKGVSMRVTNRESLRSVFIKSDEAPAAK
jgi:S1-C subfamily serine protease